ncbi:FDLD family class I lanthipeptide [Pseudomonas fluorescens]|uniref:FDLD family class I lanthipeptide n=1 Tax=Pseudomonas fluorescens TaxID=294 RepID=UPI001CD74704
MRSFDLDVKKNTAKRSQPSAAPTLGISALKATCICTESATAERYRYTFLQSPPCKALIPFSFFPCSKL